MYIMKEILLIFNLLLPNNPIFDELVEILLRRSQPIRRHALSDNYVYLHGSNFNIGQSNDSNYFDEVVSCSDSGKWVKWCKRN